MQLYLSCVYLAAFLYLDSAVFFSGTGIKNEINVNLHTSTWNIYEKHSAIASYCVFCCLLTDGCLGFVFKTVEERCQLLSANPLIIAKIPAAIGPKANGDIYYNFRRQNTGCPENEGYSYLVENNVCLKYHANPLSYQASLTFCQSEGAELLKVDSQIKHIIVEEFLVQRPEITDFVPIQGKKNGVDWFFEDGTKMAYFNWNSEEPNGVESQPEHYIAIHVDFGYRWIDIPESYFPSPFLCEIHL